MTHAVRILVSSLVLTALLALPVRADKVTVFAAASLKTAFDALAAPFARTTGHEVVHVYAGTSTLARQIEQGAPADVFVAANELWMDHLHARGLIAEESRRVLLENSLVLIAPAGRAAPIDLAAPGAASEILARLGTGGRLAMGLVNAVPAGIYGKAALVHFGLWADLAPHVAQADNVRAALALVARGEAPLGIVYASDVRADPRVAIVAAFPADSHPPIRYPAAALAGRDGSAARAYLGFLSGETARGIMTDQGFRPGAP